MNDTEVSQTAEYMEQLLPILVDPLSHDHLKEERNGDTIVELRSPTRNFRVINNIPCLIPADGDLKTQKAFSMWAKMHRINIEAFNISPIGNFSVDSYQPGVEFGRVLKGEDRNGIFLDIGCGMLRKPVYMKGADEITFIGIDPILGNTSRAFPFVQGYGDWLPFADNTFDAVIYASSLDHLIDPQQSLKDARRVLKPGGLLFVWETNRRRNRAYFKWRAKRLFGPVRYNKFHHWAFTRSSLKTLVKHSQFQIRKSIPLPDCREHVLVADRN